MIRCGKGPTVPGWVDGFASTLARIANADVDIAACRVNLALTAGVDAADEFTRACQRGGLGGYDIVHDLEKTLSLAAYSEVLLTGNGVGADVTLDSVRQVIIEMTRNALRGKRAR
jgi:hypothetical protein